MLHEGAHDSDSGTCLTLAFFNIMALHIGLFERRVHTPLTKRRSLISAVHIRCCKPKHADSNYGFQSGKLVMPDLDISYTRRMAKTTDEKITLQLMVHR